MSEKVFVLGNNIDTDQIITAEYMKINPATPDGYEKLGALAFCGLPSGNAEFINETTKKSNFTVIVAGENFGCGSSREHAPIALAASGIRIVIANSFARIFFRNCINTGALLPVEVIGNLNHLLKNGDEVNVDVDSLKLHIKGSSETFDLKPMDTMEEIIRAGGLFQYARNKGYINT